MTVILNISAGIEAESSFEVKTLSGSRVIRLGSGRPSESSSDLIFDIKAGLARMYRIFQTLSGELESSDGNLLPLEAVTMRMHDAGKGSGPVDAAALPRNAVVYSSDAAGSDDNFAVTYGLRDSAQYRAGMYRAILRYYVESGALREEIGSFDLEVEITPVFELNIQPEFSGVIEFRDLKPQGPAQKSEVLIGVKSNLGKRYQITQRMLSGLSSKEGKTVPSKYFTMRQEPLQTKGSLRVPAAAEVAAGETVVFTSDKNGSSDEFKMVYELTPAIDIPAGDYSTRISYSISEL